MSDDTTRPAAPGGTPPARKPYTRPAVIRYGDVTVLTRSGQGSKNDKGSGASTRTQ